MADKMTREQVRDWHRQIAATKAAGHLASKFHSDAADALDAHLAAMGEPVTEVIAQDLAHHGSPRAIKHLYPIRHESDLLRPGTKLYLASPASGDWDKVREVIHRLRGYRREWLDGCADKLTAALPENAK